MLLLCNLFGFYFLYCFDSVARDEAKKFHTPSAVKAAVPNSPLSTPDAAEKYMNVTDDAQNMLRMQKVKDRLDSVLVCLLCFVCY